VRRDVLIAVELGDVSRFEGIDLVAEREFDLPSSR